MPNVVVVVVVVFSFCSSVCLRCLIVDSLNFPRYNTEAGVQKR